MKRKMSKLKNLKKKDATLKFNFCKWNMKSSSKLKKLKSIKVLITLIMLDKINVIKRLKSQAKW
jgi:hypothetical protein